VGSVAREAVVLCREHLHPVLLTICRGEKGGIGRERERCN
jgi:hypothetical protein